jgi:alpha-tubulin suppressor-like RCC1 family protein
LKGDGTIWTWGLGTFGALGNNTVANISSPVQIGADKSWSKINAGRLACAAVESTGRLWVWGTNSYGSLGTNTPSINYSSMVQTTLSDTNWFDATLNNLTLMGLRIPPASATPSPTLTPTSTPTPTESPTPTPSPTPAPNFYIWGDNSSGQAGTNDTTNFTTSTLWKSTANYKQVAYGAQVIAYIKNDDTLWLAGAQASNVPSIGNNTGSSVSSFVQTSVGGTWKSVAPGSATTAIKLDGTLWAWGGNYFGQVGNGTSGFGAEVFTPVQIDANTNWVSLYNMYYGSAAINSLGQLYFWGTDNTGWNGGVGSFNFTPTQGPTNKSWSQVAMSTFGTTIALATDGSIWTWGQNTNGECGRNSATGANFPVGRVGTSTNWVKIASGFIIAYGLKNDGSLWAWGYNGYGELSQNDTVARSSPTQILGTWLDVVGGPNATWAIKSDGTVWACGGNAYGQQPFTGNKSSLVQVGSITTYTSFPIILSTAYGCIIKTGT